MTFHPISRSLDLSAVAFAKAEVVTAKCEPSLGDWRSDLSAAASAKAETRYQFERLGYFCLDADSPLSTLNSRPIFNRTITLKDTWAKEARKG